jgi:hypothetical protein
MMEGKEPETWILHPKLDAESNGAPEPVEKRTITINS